MTVEEFRAEGRRKRVPFSEAVADLIIEAVSCGVSLEEFCAEPDHPSRRTIVAWKRDYPAFGQALHDARVFRAEGRSDQIDRVIADVQEGRLDAVAGRMVVDALRWQMSMENQRYREISKHELSGPGGTPIAIDVNGDPRKVLELARFFALIVQRADDARRRLEAQGIEVEALSAPGEST